MIEGGCRCGAVRYTLALEALPLTYACHCRDCQTWTGSAFSQQALMLETALTATGPVLRFELPHPSGTRISEQRVCGVCHARLWNINTRRPGIAVVRAGTLDDSERLDCVAHIFTARKKAWVILPADTPQWPEFAPPEALMAALHPAA